MTFQGSFQLKLFYDSVILPSLWILKFAEEKYPKLQQKNHILLKELVYSLREISHM